MKRHDNVAGLVIFHLDVSASREYSKLHEPIAVLLTCPTLIDMFTFQLSSSENAAITLEDFELVRVIGRGSYAKVFVVEQRRTRRLYAMKVIKKELVNDDEVCS